MNKLLLKIIDRLYFKSILLFDHKKVEDHLKTLEPDLALGEIYKELSPFYEKPWEFYTVPNDYNTGEKIQKNEGTVAITSPYTSVYETNNEVIVKKETAQQTDTAILYIHGLKAGGKPDDTLTAALLQKGFDVFRYTLPFHHDRTPEDSYSGEYFITSNLLWTLYNMRQAVVEIKLLRDILKKQYKKVFIASYSTGGFCAGLVQCVGPCELDFDGSIYIVSGCNLASLIWDSILTTGIKEDFEKARFNKDMVDLVWGIADQAHLHKHVSNHNQLHIHARDDNVIPTNYQRKLSDLLPPKAVVELEGGHSSPFLEIQKVVDAISWFIRQTSL